MYVNTSVCKNLNYNYCITNKLLAFPPSYKNIGLKPVHLRFYLFNAWCPLNGHTYLNKSAVFCDNQCYMRITKELQGYMRGSENPNPLITYDVQIKGSEDSNNLLKGPITFYVPNTC